MTPNTASSLILIALTLLCFGMLASYYTPYAVGMLRWRRSNPPASAPAP